MNLEEIHQVGVTLSKFKYISREGVVLNPKFQEGVFMMEFKDIQTYVWMRATTTAASSV